MEEIEEALKPFKYIMEDRDQYGCLLPMGLCYSAQDKATAAREFFVAKERIDRVRLDRKEQADRIGLDAKEQGERVLLDQGAQLQQREIAHRQLDLQEDELRVRKAEVVVKAMALLGGKERKRLVERFTVALLGEAMELPAAEPLRLVTKEPD